MGITMNRPPVPAVRIHGSSSPAGKWRWAVSRMTASVRTESAPSYDSHSSQPLPSWAGRGSNKSGERLLRGGVAAETPGTKVTDREL